MKLSQQHPRHEDDNDSYYDSDSEAYNDMFGVNDHWSDKATRIIKFVIGALLVLFSIVWAYTRF